MFYLIFTFLLIQEPDYQKKLKDLNATYQSCLDEGKFMMNCSLNFYSALDELMDLILLDFQENTPKGKSVLILQNQKEWEVKTQPRFDRINHRLDSITVTNGVTPQDEVMFSYNEKALIIEERIIELIDQLK